jgi:hypothetical protein
LEDDTGFPSHPAGAGQHFFRALGVVRKVRVLPRFRPRRRGMYKYGARHDAEHAAHKCVAKDIARHVEQHTARLAQPERSMQPGLLLSTVRRSTFPRVFEELFVRRSQNYPPPLHFLAWTDHVCQKLRLVAMLHLRPWLSQRVPCQKASCEQVQHQSNGMETQCPARTSSLIEHALHGKSCTQDHILTMSMHMGFGELVGWFAAIEPTRVLWVVARSFRALLGASGPCAPAIFWDALTNKVATGSQCLVKGIQLLPGRPTASVPPTRRQPDVASRSTSVVMAQSAT